MKLTVDSQANNVLFSGVCVGSLGVKNQGEN